MKLNMKKSHMLRISPRCNVNISPLTVHGLLLFVVPRGSAVERQSLASVLSPSCARPVADG